MSPAHVLREYALIADGHRAALLGPRGELAWMCFPTWHDPGVFASLIGSGGRYQVCPRDRFVWGGYYESGSLVWRSRWVTDGGAVIECREALAYPADRERAIILRRIAILEGSADLTVALEPAADYGRRTAGAWQRSARMSRVDLDGTVWRLTGAEEATTHGRGLVELELAMEEGDEHDLVLEIATDTHLLLDDPDADRLWDSTTEHWTAALPDRFAEVVGARDVRHAAAVLHGLTAPSGGTVAAVTTALPERADANRTYDYRYVWIRDVCYVGTAGASLEAPLLLEPAVRFVRDRLLADGADLRPAYTIDGEAIPRESELGLPGYPGGGDRIGNRAGDQFQLDIFGEALQLLAEADERDLLDADGWAAIEAAVEAVRSRWEERDAGIWEIDPAWWTHSRLACVAGLRRVSARSPTPRPEWDALADTIAAATARTCVHPSGRWQRSPEDPRVDAALLLAEIDGTAGPGDARSVATYEAVADELTEDGYVYRFAHDGADSLGEAEGAFLLCNFWMSLAAQGRGDPVSAARWFERGRAATGPPGLFTEEFDVGQRQLRGNIPQAFVHALLIHAAVAQVGPNSGSATVLDPARPG